MPNRETYPSYIEFERRIKNGLVEPVYFVLVNDGYFLNRAGELLREKFAGSISDKDNFFLRYADDTSLNEILNLTSNFSSLFSEKKIIILKKCEKYGKKVDDLIEYSKNPDPQTTMILAFDKNYVLEKKLNRAIDFYDFSELQDKEYFNWLSNEFKKNGCEIDNETLNMFSDFVPKVFDLVTNEIKKVSDYLSDERNKVVTREVILKLSGFESEYSPFELMGFIIVNDGQSALNVLNYLLNKESINEVFLLTIITNMFMDLMAVKDENIQTIQNRDFYIKYKIWGDRLLFVKKFHKYSKKLNFKRIFEIIIDTDRKLKTSILDPKVLIFSLVEEITSI